MATNYWTGQGVAVAQAATATYSTYNFATTRTITINSVAISLADSGGTLTAALAAFATVLNASLHPYFSQIVWTSDATHIIGTARNPGAPFSFTGSDNNATCTNAYTVTTASAGPNDWTTAANWSLFAIPANGDTIIFKDSAISCSWGPTAVITPTLLRIDQTYTGLLGLSRNFSTASDGTATVTTAQEYRTQYCTISPTTISIGLNFSATAANGSGRIKIDTGATLCTITIYNSAAAPADIGQTAMQLKANVNTTAIYVRYAPGGVGIAAGPGETTTISSVTVSDTSTASQVYCGPGTTITTWTQNGGTNIISPAATITMITVNGGTLTVEGSSAITTLNVNGGTCVSNTTGTTTTATVNGAGNPATLDYTQSSQARTVTTLNHTKGTLKIDPSVVTLTNKVTPPQNKVTLTAA